MKNEAKSKRGKKTYSFFLFMIMTAANAGQALCQESKFALSAGGAADAVDFKWSIAGNTKGKSPNVLSELIFNNITSAGFFIAAVYKLSANLQLEAVYQRNSVIAGKGTDTDYGSDNRTDPTFEQSFSSNKGYFEMFKIGFRYVFLKRGRINIGAEASYKNLRQNFTILSPELTDLRTTYLAKGGGSDFSIQGSYRIDNRLSLGCDLAYSLISYRGEGDWNLIDMFMHPLSFSQHSNGHGTNVSVSLLCSATRSLSFCLGAKLGGMKVHKGSDTSYLKNGTEVSTQFNGAAYNFYGIQFGTTFLF